MDTLLSAAIIVGPVYGYYAQYVKVRTEQSIGNFSIDVCAILIFANVLRILFWFGDPFELPLLFQSILMIAAQCILLKECLRIQHQTAGVKFEINESYDNFDARHSLTSQKFWSSFWRWRDLRSYGESVIAVTVILTMFTMMFSHNETAVQMVGLASATVEATLGIPQLLKNYRSKNAAGMSYALIGSWFLGDSFKTAYFFIKSAPTQFMLCGIVQLTVDILILLQMKFYKEYTLLV